MGALGNRVEHVTLQYVASTGATIAADYVATDADVSSQITPATTTWAQAAAILAAEGYRLVAAVVTVAGPLNIVTYWEYERRGVAWQ